MKPKRLLITLAVVALTVATVFGTAFFLLTSPSIKIAGWQELDESKLNYIHRTITVKDMQGNILAENIYSRNRIYTPLSEIPQHTVDAFVSIEDKRFYTHHGIDPIRMLGAAKSNILSFSFKEGASTITQQLIKNTHLSSEKTFSRKLQEIRIAKALEKRYSKDQIMEAYLNVLYFGNNVYGIGQAARTFFDKSVRDLSIAESALLAGIINNPSRFNPITRGESAQKRRNTVLDRMYAQGKLDQTSLTTEKAQPLELHLTPPSPYFGYIDAAVNEAAQALDCLPEELFEKNATLVTAIDKRIFDGISYSMSDILYKSNNKIRITIVRNSDAALLYDVSNVQETPLSQILRQPGSALKPFVSYAPALEKRLIYPVSVLKDERTDFNGYSPKNFNDKYYGNVTVADSLAQSLNVPAVKLTDMCGLSYAKSVATRFGITFSPQDSGLAVALGGLHNGVTLSSLADAYATLARGGIYKKSRYVQAVYVKDECVYASPDTDTRVVGEDTAFLLTDMLRKCAKEGTAQKLREHASVAAKTGTVERGNKNSDAYCIAYTPAYTVAVWYGNDTDEEENVYGGGKPCATAKRILETLNDDSTFQTPSCVRYLNYDDKRLRDEGIVYLAAPTLPKRYCRGAYFSAYHLPAVYSYSKLSVFEDDFPLFGYGDNFEIVDRLVK